jgi:hypothetical protein
VTARSVERTLSGCPFAPAPANDHRYTFRSASSGSGGTLSVEFNQAAGFPVATLTFTGTASSDGRTISGTLRWRRTDQGPPLDWVVVANITLTSGATGGTPPPAPTGLRSQVSGRNVTLSWNAAADLPDAMAADPATSYVLQVGTASGRSDLFTGNVGGVTAVTGSGLSPNLYYWRVVGVNSFGQSAASAEAQFTIGGAGGPCTFPSAPRNFRGSVSGTRVTLRWDGPATGDASAFIIEAGSALGLKNLYEANIGNATELSVNAPDGTYYVRVRAVNSCGVSAPSQDIVIVVPNVVFVP